MMIVKGLFAAVIGYLLGSLNWSIILSRLIDHSDIRGHGSGNAGMTNTLRTFGKRKAAMVFALDAAKTVAAVLLARLLLPQPEAAMIGGGAALLGHVYPLYYGFKGGKGIVCGVSMAAMLDWRMAAMVFGVFLAVLAMRKIISLASISAAAAFPVSALVFHFGDWRYIVHTAAFGGFVIWMHRANIKRLMAGTEPKIGAGRKSGKGSD